jgi:predicted ester cyclase
MLRGAFPNLEVTVEDQVAEGDRVVTRWITRGTHKGEFQGIPPTGRQVAITGITIFLVADDKLLEGWSNADMLGMLQQLGAVPEPGQPG